MRFWSTRLLIFFLTGCAVSPVHPSLRTGVRLPDLIPVRDFVANRSSNFGYSISPDGKKLAWVAIKGTSLHLYIKNLENNIVKTIRADNWYGGVIWAQDSRHLISDAFVQQGTENTIIVTLDTEQTGEDMNLIAISPAGGVCAQLVQQIVNDPEHVLIAHNRRDSTVFDLFRVNIKTKEQTLIAENPGNVTQWITSSQGKLTGRIVKHSNTFTLELGQSDDTGFSPIYSWDSNDSVQVVSIMDQGARIYLLSNKGRDRQALVEFLSASGEEKVVYADPVVDITSVYKHPVTGKPLIAFSVPDYPRATLLDQSLQSTFGIIKNKAPVNFTIDSSDNQLHRITISLGTDKGSEYYLYDVESDHLELLGSSPSLAYKNILADTNPVKITSRDNIPLRGYLTLPKGISPHRLPLVLLVHGGPWERDYWIYNSEIQFLANRGYAVMQINYRGSTGYGRHFQELAIGEFAGKMQEDLLDGINWVVGKGIADPSKIAIDGGSYGGYAALVGLSSTPDMFACGIDINGPADLVKLAENYPPYWKLGMDRLYQYVGDPGKASDRAIMQAKSPLYMFNRITKPLMVIQSANDVRVQNEQAIELVTKLKQGHKDIDFWLVPGEGHVIAHWPLRLKQFRKTEDFLANCLGGRSSGYDFYELGAWLF